MEVLGILYDNVIDRRQIKSVSVGHNDEVVCRSLSSFI